MGFPLTFGFPTVEVFFGVPYELRNPHPWENLLHAKMQDVGQVIDLQSCLLKPFSGKTIILARSAKRRARMRLGPQRAWDLTQHTYSSTFVTQWVLPPAIKAKSQTGRGS